jgi:ABC-type antimicrobial peptide transport system permease subunit
VVGDVKYDGLADAVQPALYQPLSQQWSRGVALLVKTDLVNPLSLSSAVQGRIRTLDPDLPVTQVSTMEQHLNRAMDQPRFRTILIGLFAVVALILSCIGIYGVISYSVTRRTHEIGIRMALGARKADVLGMVLRQAMYLAVIGVALGLGGAFGLTRLMAGLLFGVKPTDATTFCVTALLLAATALLAAYLPARRAARVDPMIALRHE